jgi:hypothetical protein
VIAEATRLINGLEAGNLSSAEAYNIIEDLDPLLVYFSLMYIKRKYPNPGAAQNLRLMELMGGYDQIKRTMSSQSRDSMVEWFNDTYDVRDFYNDAHAYVELIVDKMES